MKDKLTLQLKSNGVAELTLNSVSPLAIDVPTTTAQRARALVDTTANWQKRTSYIPVKGEIIIYSDRNVVDEHNYPGIKIGDGLAYVVDLPFVGQEVEAHILGVLNEHIEDMHMHITDEEREFWNNKLNYSIDGEKLIFNRN